MEGHRWLSVTSAYNSNPWWAPRYIPSSRTISLPAKTVSRPPFRPRTQESSSWGAQPKDVRFLTPPPQPLARLLSLMARRANRNDYNNDHTYLVSPFPSSSFGSMHSPHLEKNITLRGEEERVVINRCELASKRMHLRFSKKKRRRRRKGWRSKGKQPQGDFQGDKILTGWRYCRATPTPLLIRAALHFLPATCSHNFRWYSVVVTPT